MAARFATSAVDAATIETVREAIRSAASRSAEALRIAHERKYAL